MRQPAAGRVGARRVDRYAAFFDACDLAFFIHHERSAVRHAKLLNQNPVIFRNLAHVIAEDRVSNVEFFLPVRQSRRKIGADRQNLRAIRFKLCDTRLVRVEFLGSTTGERGDKEGQNDGLLAAEVR